MSTSVAEMHTDPNQLSNRVVELLRRLGVPSFAGGAVTRRCGRIVPLLWMIAFQVGVLSAFSEVSAEIMIGAALLVALLALFALPLSASVIRVASWWHKVLLPLVVIVPVVTFSWVRNTIFPIDGSDPRWLLPHYWCNTAITLVVLYAAMIIVLPQAQASHGMRWAAHWFILFFAAAANMVSVMTFPLSWALGDIGRGRIGQDISLPPLLVAGIVLTVAAFLPRADTGENRRARSFAVAAPTAMLILIFGLINARWVGVVDRFALFVTVSAVCAVLVLLAVVASFLPLNAGRQLMNAPGLRHLQRHVTEPRQILWVPLFVIAYPVIALFLDQKANVLGQYFEGMGVVAVALVFNLVYLAFIWTLVHFDVDWIVTWSIGEFWRRTVDTLRHIAASAPLLLLAVAVLALTAETWQIAYALPRTKLILFCGLQLLFAVFLGIGWTVPRIYRQSRFKTWDEVIAEIKRAQRGGGGEQNEHDEIIDDLVRAVEAEPRKPELPKKLGVPAWANAVLVVAAYQFFVFPVIIAVLFLAFLAICYTIPAELAAEWIFGDGERGRWVELVGLSPLDSPWVRVPVLLTVFSILYFATHSLASTRRRKEYFKRGDAAIRTRFAIRLGLWFVRETQDERRRAHDDDVPHPDPIIPCSRSAPRRGTPLPSHR